MVSETNTGRCTNKDAERVDTGRCANEDTDPRRGLDCEIPHRLDRGTKHSL